MIQFSKIKTIVIQNRFWLTILIFIVWVGLFDDNNLIDRISSLKRLNQLNEDKVYLLNKISEDKQNLENLKNNEQTIEKFAREQYFMKRDNEDVFIIVEDE
jgi:cell division protein FtsB